MSFKRAINPVDNDYLNSMIGVSILWKRNSESILDLMHKFVPTIPNCKLSVVDIL